MSAAHLIVVAKSPVPGRVKTRLCPPLTHRQAARVAEAALADTLRTVAATPASARTLVLDGAPGRWLPAGFTVLPQRGDGLAERLASAFDDAQAIGGGPLLLIGMDTPQLSSGQISEACASLSAPNTDAVLGLATDGGWWALGLPRADPALLHGIPMSTSTTGAAQAKRLRDRGMRVTLLDELTDVDDWASATAVAATIPDSRFARSVRMAR